jgi:hypothetical protein
MSAEPADQLERRLRRLGLSRGAIRAAWPRWWSSEAESSSSAQLELRLAIGRHLGIDPRSLLDARATPRFIWGSEARFKHLTAESDVERDAIASFGRAIATLLVASGPPGARSLVGEAPSRLREAILTSASQPFARLTDLLSVGWSVGIPIAYLRVFPWPRKRMAAMSVAVGNRAAVLLAKEALYPAQVAFFIAHELGHIAAGHVHSSAVIVDMDQDAPEISGDDSEEGAADRFALELLTGSPEITVLSGTGYASGPELARVAIDSAARLGIEPGTLALLFGYSTGRWATAMSAMKRIYSGVEPIWREINRIALTQLDLSQMSDDARDYLSSVLGFGEP